MRSLLTLVAMAGFFGTARAEVATVVTAYQYGLTYLPLMVMQDQQLVERKAEELAGLKLKTEWRVFSGPAAINDGILAGSLHFGGVGTSSLVTLWAKTRQKLAIRAVGSLSCMPVQLLTNQARIKSLADFTASDKIALPSVKVGVQAVTLQMAAAQAFGPGQFDRLDALTVGMGHPDAMIAMLAGKAGISGHFASAPYISQELAEGKGRIHSVLKSYEVLGGPASFTLVVASSRWRDENPKVYAAYVAAFEAATALINSRRDEAARIYLKVSGSKESLESIRALLANPDHVFDLTPRAIHKYADFMYQVGTIKEKATTWQDLVHPNLLSRPGS